MGLGNSFWTPERFLRLILRNRAPDEGRFWMWPRYRIVLARANLKTKIAGRGAGKG